MPKLILNTDRKYFIQKQQDDRDLPSTISHDLFNMLSLQSSLSIFILYHQGIQNYLMLLSFRCLDSM